MSRLSLGERTITERSRLRPVVGGAWSDRAAGAEPPRCGAPNGSRDSRGERAESSDDLTHAKRQGAALGTLEASQLAIVERGGAGDAESRAFEHAHLAYDRGHAPAAPAALGAGRPGDELPRGHPGHLTARDPRRELAPHGDVVHVPTLPEMARIKAWLLVTRYTVRDYLDSVALLERLGPEGCWAALAPLDELYHQPSGASPLAELSERLAEAAPLDAARVELATYKGLVPPWNDWEWVAARGRSLAPIPAQLAMRGP